MCVTISQQQNVLSERVNKISLIHHVVCNADYLQRLVCKDMDTG